MAVLTGPGSGGAASLFYALQLGSGARLSKQVPPGGRRTVRGDTAAVRLDRFCGPAWNWLEIAAGEVPGFNYWNIIQQRPGCRVSKEPGGAYSG